ncbi:glutaredoxin [Variovorax sp. MHTC-1]|uniref:glutaredoxin n=1 Tax=Variovorax sp. MHTC-1 TaxID=2495593 RepID=UPI001C8CF6B7|nr:glutaredoxin [Variovorax sp. MHTC-1]
MKVEVLHAIGCEKCLRELDSLRAAALQFDPTVEWTEIDILAALDYAVELGVLRPPAVAINGALVFLRSLRPTRSPQRFASVA